jgi:hypothetical protein
MDDMTTTAQMGRDAPEFVELARLIVLRNKLPPASESDIRRELQCAYSQGRQDRTRKR